MDGQHVWLVLAVAVVLAWQIPGPFFGFSGNVATRHQHWHPTIVTFLMVFLIQRAQNKDALALQLKVNERLWRRRFWRQ